MALQLICDYSDSDDSDQLSVGFGCSEIMTEQPSSSSKALTVDDGVRSNSLHHQRSECEAEDIEKWKEARKKRFPKVPSSFSSADSHQEKTKVTSNVDKQVTVDSRCAGSRGVKRKMKDLRSLSSHSSPLSSRQRKLTLYEKVVVSKLVVASKCILV